LIELNKNLLLPMLVATVISIVIGNFIIAKLRKAKIGQSIRDDGPQSHLAKAGTPTMGGIIFVISTIASLLIFGKINSTIAVILIGMIGFGGIGFIDDYMKLIMKRSLGLNEKQKLILQFIVSILLIVVASKVMPTSITNFLIPFVHKEVNLGFFAYPILVFIMVGTVNATNLTDGLDGLATSVTIPVFLALVVIGAMKNADISTFAAVFTGSLFGFLVYNSNPASVFMGDVGSMAIGGALVAITTLLNMNIYLIILGGVYMIEVLSVIIQTISYRTRNKKRVFLMSPIHHHFELKGHKEPKIVATFMVVSIILSLITLMDVIAL